MLEIIEHVDDLLLKLNTDHWCYEQASRQARCLKGMVLGHKKNFKESYAIFKDLVKEDPENYKYKVWFEHAKLGLYNWIFTSMMLFGTVLIFLDLLFELSDELPFDIGRIGLVIMPVTYLSQKGLGYYFKKKKEAASKADK